MNIIKHLVCFCVLSFGIHFSVFCQLQTAIVPLGGNTWKSGEERNGGGINHEGIVRWTDPEASYTTYVRLATRGSIDVSIRAKAVDGVSKIKITALETSAIITISDSDWTNYAAGSWIVEDTGYIAIKIEGIRKSGERFADISSMELGGTAVNDKTRFVRNNEGNFYYWGRRGPSVHLSYMVPTENDIEWFYNEVTVTEGNDIIGSYYMANGFADGYFGMQVNSSTERRILFSVWSPFHTDDPKQIPEDQKIVMLRKGKDVYTGEFGNEGSGGQSFLRYNWKTGNTYGFLLRGQPDGEAHTVYTAYFYAPEKKEWMLIASFRRPKGARHLKRLHSFLENFSPEQGNQERKVFFTNQWIRDTSGKWYGLTKARFTGDNTAGKGFRMDYGGGAVNDKFYLRNCGFFSDYTPLQSVFERKALNRKPRINLEKLPGGK